MLGVINIIAEVDLLEDINQPRTVIECDINP